MTISEFSFRLIFIFIPGIIAFIIIDNFTTHKETKLHHWIIYSMMLGTVSYLIAEIIAAVWWGIFYAGICIYYNTGWLKFFQNVLSQYPSFFIPDIMDLNHNINIIHIMIANFIAYILGRDITKSINNGTFFEFAVKHNISNKFTALNACQKFLTHYNDRDWIRVRDVLNNRCYQCKLAALDSVNSGLALSFVDVYKDDTSEFLYSSEAICLLQKSENLIIELTEKSPQDGQEYHHIPKSPPPPPNKK